MGVIDHGYTRAELHELGVYKEPINMSVVLDNKYIDGLFERHKVRMAVAGHKYNMQKGVDYQEVFAPAPNQNTGRLLSALTCILNLKRKSWDIKLAYCWADLPDNQMIALKYPKGYERSRGIGDGTQEPEYILLKKNCYGLPAAGKTWADHRDKFMNEHFNDSKKQYSCTQCIYDPCLFYITRGERIRPDSECTSERRPFNEEAWVSIHTDDCDAYGTSDKLLNDIFKAHDTRWKAKLVDSSFMLGIKRDHQRVFNQKTLQYDVSVELTMTPYVEGMYNAHKEFINAKHRPQTPFPHGLMLSHMDVVPETESQAVLDRGYMRAVGMILWAARGVYPECAQGVNQLGSFMAKPSEKAWTAAMHMIAYMNENKTKGIKFSNDAPMQPAVFSDASNKPDPFDGLSRYGFSITMSGGPISFGSKKLPHVGLSAFHNEYMALRYSATGAVWLRQILQEIGCSYIVEDPTPVYGDNLQANRLTKDDFVSSNNQYVYLPYHWTKELVKKNIVKVPYVCTKMNIADLMTKSVPRETIKALRDKLCGYDTKWLWRTLDGDINFVSFPTVREVRAAWTKFQWAEEDADNFQVTMAIGAYNNVE